jgi:hypothetical protein
MELIEQLAQAALEYNHLRLRSLVQDLLQSKIPLSQLSRPTSSDPRVLALSAALIELLALRQGQLPPTWTQSIGALREPFYMIASVDHMTRLRELCETQSPEPLRKRRLYAPPNFLQFA